MITWHAFRFLEIPVQIEYFWYFDQEVQLKNHVLFGYVWMLDISFSKLKSSAGTSENHLNAHLHSSLVRWSWSKELFHGARSNKNVDSFLQSWRQRCAALGFHERKGLLGWRLRFLQRFTPLPPTPQKTNMTGWNIQHLKMYFPLKMVIFQPVMLVFKGVNVTLWMVWA